MAESERALVLGDIGARSVGGTLSSLLALTSDAVIVFDGSGRILLANEEAESLFAHLVRDEATDSQLANTDIRSLFRWDNPGPDELFSLDALPFVCDGTSQTIERPTVTGQALRIVVRCDEVSAPGATYLLVAHVAGDTAKSREHDRLVAELSRSNQRLAGTLRVILGTLDSPDIVTLMNRVLEELCSTLDADGALMYLSAANGMHLRARSTSLDDTRLVRYLYMSSPIEYSVRRAGKALRLQVKRPMGTDLRKGRLADRELLEEESHQTMRMRARLLPPFSSFFAVPVWFAGHLVALIEVGWRQTHALRREDADLLDAVAQYLSVQLVGALAALRTRREDELQAVANDIRETMASEGLSDDAMTPTVTSLIEEALSCTCCLIADASGTDRVYVDLPAVGGIELSKSMLQELSDALEGTDIHVASLDADDDFCMRLRDMGCPCQGAVVHLHAPKGEALLLVLRPMDDEPFDDLELDFLDTIADAIGRLSTGESLRREDRRISQALQTGMRNELQEVQGISAQGVYSSATRQAFVGGDFYDLVRLPGRLACVIMGDVSGKGVEAASVSAAVKTALAAYAWEGLNPARMVRLLNDFLLGFARVETFATLFVGIVDLEAATITYCSAGHPPAVLLRADTGELRTLSVQSGAVGAFHDMEYRDGQEKLRAGDILLLYTDGTTEARSPDGTFFGDEGLRDAVLREGALGFDGLLDRLLATLDSFTEQGLEDDVAMVSLRFDELG